MSGKGDRVTRLKVILILFPFCLQIKVTETKTSPHDQMARTSIRHKVDLIQAISVSSDLRPTPKLLRLIPNSKDKSSCQIGNRAEVATDRD